MGSAATELPPHAHAMWLEGGAEGGTETPGGRAGGGGGEALLARLQMHACLFDEHGRWVHHAQDCQPGGLASSGPGGSLVCHV